MAPTILTVDDDPLIRRAIVAILGMFECRVLEAPDGARGLAIARAEHPDLILLDFDMPVMTGAEMLARLRADPDLGRVPVIILTSDSRPETVLGLARLGVTDYIVKPAPPGAIAIRVQRAVPLTRTAAPCTRVGTGA